MRGPDILKAPSRRIISSVKGPQEVSRDSGLASFEGWNSSEFQSKIGGKIRDSESIHEMRDAEIVHRDYGGIGREFGSESGD